MRASKFFCLPLSLIFLPALLPAKDPKLKPEEVVAQHLKSIGSAEARAAVKTRIAEGTTTMRVLTGGQGKVEGRAFLFCEGSKYRTALPFDFADYWGEHFYADGGKAEVGFSQPTRRSNFGDFLNQYSQILQEGLPAGALSTTWPLADVAGKQPKLDYGGMKKIEGKELHLLTYRMKKGQGDVQIQLFFDPETFRHVRSVYSALVQAQIGATPEQSSQQQESRFSLEELFGDFRSFDDLTLPTHWTIRMSSNVGNRSSMREWDVVWAKITHNEPIDPKNFVIEGRK